MKKLIFTVFSIIVLVSGCTKKDWLDINVNPNYPAKAQLSQLLTGSEVQMANFVAIGWGDYGPGLSEVLSVYMHQISQREEMDQYGITGTSNYTKYPWTLAYSGALEDINQMIKQGTASGDMVYVGIAKLLKAYTFSVLVDVYGDVPFLQANQLIEGYIYPTYDQGATIYPSLIQMINEGIADIQDDSTSYFIPETDDLIYNGDVAKWVKMAKTLKLKLYNQLRLVPSYQAEVATQCAALISEGDLISSESENFALPFGTSNNPDNRHPGYREYEAGQKGHYISPWFYEILKGMNPNMLTDIEDPRIPYYFYNQLADGQETREGNPTEYRDGGFVSIYFGSVGINRDHSTDGSMTVMGLYPVGGRFDDGGAIAISGTSGTGAVPLRFITYTDRLFIEAELYQTGVVTGDAKAKFQQAMESAFAQVDWVVASSSTSQVIPALTGSTEATDYVTAVLALFDAASSAGQLELIMTEKWISSFGNSIDQYNDYRRTGYPVIWDPTNANMAPGGFVTPPEGDPVPVRLTRGFQLTFPWSNEDLDVNPNAPAQKDATSFRVFWDIN